MNDGTKRIRESPDRRFKLTKEGEMRYHHNNKDIFMSVEKLIASLSLTTTQLFKYLTTSSNNLKDVRYKNNERKMIKTFVRLSGLPRQFIRSTKMREIC